MSDLLTILAADGNGGGDPTGGAVPVWVPWALVGVGLLLLCGVIVLLLRGRTTSAARPQAGAELADLRSSLVEVKRLAASVAEDLDRRAERLERLIAQADELLERGTEQPSDASVQHANRGGRGLRQTSGSSPAVDDLTQRVFTLADQGRSAQQIAQALRQPIGNIELMLALRGDR